MKKSRKSYALSRLHILALAAIVFSLFAGGLAGKALAHESGHDEEVFEVAREALSGNWDKVIKEVPGIIEHEPRLSQRFSPLLALAHLSSGDPLKASMALGGRADELSILTEAAIHGKSLSLHGGKTQIKKPEIFIIEFEDPAGLNIGLFPKPAEKIALKKAFRSVVKGSSPRMIELFNARVLQKKDLHFITGVELATKGGRGIYMAFVDSGRMSEELGLVKRVQKIGLVTKTGSDARRKALAEELSSEGFIVEDFGRGSYFNLGEKARLVGVVAELDEEASVGGSVLSSNFKRIDGAVKVTIFNAATGEHLTQKKEQSAVIHLDEEKGKEIAVAQSYKNVGAYIRGAVVEFEVRVDWLAVGRPRLEFTVNTDKLFSINYKGYAKASIGELVLKNNTERAFTGVTALFYIRDYMDFPTQIEFGEIPARGSAKKEILPVFNRRILDLTEDAFLQSEIKVSYLTMGKEETSTVHHPVFFYERHALVWDDKSKIAAFVTPKDPAVMDFTSQAVSGYRDFRLPKNIVLAKAAFESLGVAGVTYIRDPNNPYDVVYGLSNVVDYVQFPRETLTRKAGDCDDLSSLYASMLESVGIRTKLIDVPGHIYMMFDTEIPESGKLLFGFPEGSYVINDGTIWIPVEVTLSGSSFTEAWKKGMEEFAREQGPSMRIVDLKEAWRTYTPPNLAPIALGIKATTEDVEKRFSGELLRLERERLNFLAKNIDGLDVYGLNELLIIYAMDGELERAMDVGERILKAGEDPAALNNVGNLHYLKGNFERAISGYKASAAIDPDDAEVWVNLARSYRKKGMPKEAKAAFDRAVAIDRSVKDRHPALLDGFGD